MEGIRLNEAKHESYLQLWRGRVMECRNSGKSVAAWCEENGINIKTYYYWQKQVWDKAANAIIPCGQGGHPQVRTVQFAEVNLVPANPSTDADIIIRKNSWTVEIYDFYIMNLGHKGLREEYREDRRYILFSNLPGIHDKCKLINTAL